MYDMYGWLVDLLGTHYSFMIFVTGRLVASILHVALHRAAQFSFLRLLLGAAEGMVAWVSLTWGWRYIFIAGGALGRGRLGAD